MDARLETPRDVAADDRDPLRRGNAALPRCRCRFSPRRRRRPVSRRGLVRLEGAVTGAVSVGRARSDRAHRRDDVAVVGREGTRSRIRATVWPTIDRLPALSAGARAQAPGRSPGAAELCAISARRSRRCGSISTRPMPRARRPGSLRRCWARRHARLRRRRARRRGRAPTRTPLLLALTPGPPRRAARCRCACRRRCAMSMFRVAAPRTTTAAGGGRMSTPPSPRSGRRAHARAQDPGHRARL